MPNDLISLVCHSQRGSKPKKELRMSPECHRRQVASTATNLPDDEPWAISKRFSSSTGLQDSKK
jgi:hypothetical protein